MMEVLIIIAVGGIILFLVGVGVGGAHVREEVYKNIKRLEYSKISDGQFRDIVVNTYVTESEKKNE